MIRRAVLILLLLATPAFAQMRASQAPPSVDHTPRPPPPPVETPDRGSMQKQDTFRDAALAPLEDLNIKSSAIPDVLNRAVADPYDTDGLGRCEAIAAEIGKLDAALGPDLDEAPPPDGRSRMQKVGSAVKSASISAVRDEATSIIPLRGWVRKLSGAARHDKAVTDAIRSGGVRRGYLKGVGMQRNCAPPAAPSWFVPTVVKASNAEAPRGQTGLLGLIFRFFAWLRSLLPF